MGPAGKPREDPVPELPLLNGHAPVSRWGRVMVPAIGVIGELAVVSIALGALFWALGQTQTGKRAIV